MPKLNTSHTSAIVIGLFVFILSIGTIFADDLNQVATDRAAANKETGEVKKNLLIKQRFTSADIEDKLANMKEKLASKEAILKAKLQEFRDQNKATAAARISNNLNKINQNQTIAMQKHLDYMSVILDKLEVRVNKLSPDIKDPTATKIAIDAAREVIASVSAEVADQAQRDYTIQATNEARIRFDAKTMRDKLHKDLSSLRKDIIDAKQAVASVIRVAKSGLMEKLDREDKEGTSSGKQ